MAFRPFEQRWLAPLKCRRSGRNDAAPRNAVSCRHECDTRSVIVERRATNTRAKSRQRHLNRRFGERLCHRHFLAAAASLQETPMSAIRQIAINRSRTKSLRLGRGALMHCRNNFPRFRQLPAIWPSIVPQQVEDHTTNARSERRGAGGSACGSPANASAAARREGSGSQRVANPHRAVPARRKTRGRSAPQDRQGQPESGRVSYVTGIAGMLSFADLSD
jgi:hypothetical protein